MMSTSRALELLHMDLFGPTTYVSIDVNKYGLVIVDDFSRLLIFLMLKWIISQAQYRYSTSPGSILS